MPVLVGAVDSPSGSSGCLPAESLTAAAVWYQGLGAFDSKWASVWKAAAILWTSAAKTVEWLGNQPTRPKAVILHGTSAPFLRRLLPWCRRNRVALICDVVEWYYPGQVIGGRWTPIYWSGEYSMRHLVPRCDGIIAISRLLESYYTKAGCRVIRIPPTTDVAGVPASSHTPAEDGRINLVYAGVPGKKDLLANALEGLRRVDPHGQRFRFRLVGPDEQAVRRLCPNYPAEAIEIMGRRSHEETLKMVGEADFSVLLRPNERYAHAGFPTKVVESLTCGTPVICNLTSDLAEHIHDGQEGVVCRDSSPEAFAQALRTAGEIGRDRMMNMRRAARAQAERAFDYRIYVSALGQFMREATRGVA